MAEYDLTGIRMNGERIMFDEAHLHLADGGRQGWSLAIDGAHILAQQTNQRVEVDIVTDEGRELEGEALVTFAGHRDHATEIYDDVELTGIGALKELT